MQTGLDDAALWAVRLDARPLDAGEQAALDRWIDSDERHAAALLRAQATLSYLDRGRALGCDGEDDRRNPAAWSRRTVIAASVGAVTIGAAGLWKVHGDVEVVDAGVGELRRVPLADGSLATLNTNTRVEVSIAARQRTVRIENGEAWFSVATDRKRPFVVEAGSVRVRAVGTAFSVRRRDGGADVLVTEGTVETWVAGREGDKRRITAGSRGFVPQVSANIEVTRAPQDIDRALAWRSGDLVLDGERLSYAIGELNRYNVRQIALADPSLGDETLVGYFRTTEPENFARAVAAMTGGHVVSEGENIIIHGNKL